MFVTPGLQTKTCRHGLAKMGHNIMHLNVSEICSEFAVVFQLDIINPAKTLLCYAHDCYSVASHSE